MASNWVDFKTVKQAAPIAAVLQQYGITGLRRHGQELRGCCPIHKGDSNDSFHVSVEKNAFQCFVCGAKGNVLDFVAAMERCSIRDAGLKLQDWFGLAAGGAPKQTTSTNRQLAREKERGEREPASNKPLTFELTGIDYAHSYLASRGITAETAAHFGVGFFPGKGSMAGRVVIPIHDENGELVAYAGRSIDGSEPRYKLPAGFQKSAVLYNLHRAMATGERGLIVVEGFFDCMKVHQAGYPFVVALMGCSMSERQEELLVERGSKGIILMLDGDEAGQRGAAEIAARLVRRVFTRVVDLPAGKQPDQMAAEEIQELLKNNP